MFKNIFWLEDNPDFLGCYSDMSKSYGCNLDIKDLLSRIEFAFCFNEGMELIKREKFDLYVLDADFPDDIEAGRKMEIQNLLDCLKRGEEVDFLPPSNRNRIIYDNFIEIYDEIPKDKKTIVHSVSELAMLPAFKRGIPFYSKSGFKFGEGEKKSRERLIYLINRNNEELDKDKFSNWEVGGVPELIKNYLV